MMPGHDRQPAQDVPGWRLWVSATGRHWAIRCAILTAAQITGGAKPILWAQDGAGLAALISAQDELIVTMPPAWTSGHRRAASAGGN
jgi:hypothetical protein